MKNLIYLFACIGILSISLASCDVVEEPFTYAKQEVNDSCEAYIFKPHTGQYTRKVLLEDYTGHMCSNCPRAAEKAKELKKIYGEQLITIAVHAGFSARLNEPHFTTDFTTKTGEKWDKRFGISRAGNPNGMVNRIGYPEANHILGDDQWAQIVEEQTQRSATIGLQLKASHNENANLICIDVQTEILESTSDVLRLNIVLVEDGIISYQKDNSAEGKIPDYEHNHVMRKSLTGEMGNDLKQETYTKGDYLLNRYSTEIDESWNVNQIAVIAFVSHAETSEVLQVEEVHLKGSK